ncbi:MAG: peptidoglycan-binding protein [Oscillospiraceae bacterium]|nr:peptidoglycan-binding protein [Oscillospiraceae bacterium]
MFTPRLTKPEKGNPYYNTAAAGGCSTAIIGNPTDPGCNVLANCVGYAAGRFNEIIGKGKFLYFQYPPNAEDFYDTGIRQGLNVGLTPKLGAIIVWAKGKTAAPADGAGHVAVVEQINADGSIVTSESGYGCANPFWTSVRKKGTGNWSAGPEYRFLGFVYQPEEAGEPLLKKGDSGEAVRKMQELLCAHGYLRKNEIDGIFGTITLGALLAFQFENGLAVDGICGPATMAALKR